MEFLVRERKFFRQFNNGQDFLSNPTDFATHLKGSLLNKLRALSLVEISWSTDASTSDPLTVVAADNSISRLIGNFITDGFSVGDSFDFYNPSAAAGVIFSAEIISMSDKVMIFTPISGIVPSYGSQASWIEGYGEKTGAIFQYGLIENDDSINFISKIDGSDQGYYASGVGQGGSTGFVNAEPLGSVIGWDTGPVKVRFVGNNGYKKRYEVQHDFIITPYYTEGEIDDLKSGVLQELVRGDNSLKYVAQYEFRSVLSNPNSSIKGQDDLFLGSVAGAGENFNGFNNKYSLSNVVYTDVLTSEEIAVF